MANSSYSSLMCKDVVVYPEDTILKFVFYDENGGNFNLVGSTCTIDICSFGDTTNILDTFFGSITSPNIVRYTLTQTFLSSLTSGKYIFQPKIITASLKQYKPIQGVFTLVQEIN